MAYLARCTISLVFGVLACGPTQDGSAGDDSSGGSEPGSDSGESAASETGGETAAEGGSGDEAGEVTGACDAICFSALEVQMADGRSDFTLELSSDGFGPVTVACPEGPVESETESVTGYCTEGGVWFEKLGLFPLSLTFTIDGAPAQVVEPVYDTYEVCGYDCNQATIVL